MRERSSCTLDGCDEPNKARGRCSKHYQQWMKANRAVVVADEKARASRHAAGCVIIDCGRPIKSQAYRWCRQHYLQWWRTGDPIAPERPSGCAVDGCPEPFHCRGWCESHYHRWCYSGDPVRLPAVIECELCGTSFTRPADGRTRRCDACRAAVQRTAMSDRLKRERAAPAYQQSVLDRRQARSEPCLVCRGRVEQEATHGPLRKFCSDPCWEAHEAAWRQNYFAITRDIRAARQHQRRAMKWAVAYERFNPREIFDRDNWICSLCSRPIDPLLRHPDRMSPSLDHVIPLSRGGAHTRANSAAAHLTCNIRKHDRLPSELVG